MRTEKSKTIPIPSNSIRYYNQASGKSTVDSRPPEADLRCSCVQVQNIKPITRKGLLCDGYVNALFVSAILKVLNRQTILCFSQNGAEKELTWINCINSKSFHFACHQLRTFGWPYRDEDPIEHAVYHSNLLLVSTGLVLTAFIINPYAFSCPPFQKRPGPTIPLEIKESYRQITALSINQDYICIAFSRRIVYVWDRQNIPKGMLVFRDIDDEITNILIRGEYIIGMSRLDGLLIWDLPLSDQDIQVPLNDGYYDEKAMKKKSEWSEEHIDITLKSLEIEGIIPKEKKTTLWGTPITRATQLNAAESRQLYTDCELWASSVISKVEEIRDRESPPYYIRSDFDCDGIVIGKDTPGNFGAITPMINLYSLNTAKLVAQVCPFGNSFKGVIGNFIDLTLYQKSILYFGDKGIIRLNLPIDFNDGKSTLLVNSSRYIPLSRWYWHEILQLKGEQARDLNRTNEERGKGSLLESLPQEILQEIWTLSRSSDVVAILSLSKALGKSFQDSPWWLYQAKKKLGPFAQLDFRGADWVQVYKTVRGKNWLGSENILREKSLTIKERIQCYPERMCRDPKDGHYSLLEIGNALDVGSAGYIEETHKNLLINQETLQMSQFLLPDGRRQFRLSAYHSGVFITISNDNNLKLYYIKSESKEQVQKVIGPKLKDKCTAICISQRYFLVATMSDDSQSQVQVFCRRTKALRYILPVQESGPVKGIFLRGQMVIIYQHKDESNFSATRRGYLGHHGSNIFFFWVLDLVSESDPLYIEGEFMGITKAGEPYITPNGRMIIIRELHHSKTIGIYTYQALCNRLIKTGYWRCPDGRDVTIDEFCQY